jgi:bifunctional DNA-binding transcriptional regulator/antitoxin component of YhaV-PrlF toxin-antitoxin module
LGWFFGAGFKYLLSLGEKRLGKVEKGLERQKKVLLNMPLTESVTFKTKLQRRSRIVVPRHYRWRFKMEPGELLRVSVEPLDSDSGLQETFLAKMSGDGRIVVPKLIMEILQLREEKDLSGVILEVILWPSGRSDE